MSLISLSEKNSIGHGNSGKEKPNESVVWLLKVGRINLCCFNFLMQRLHEGGYQHFTSVTPCLLFSHVHFFLCFCHDNEEQKIHLPFSSTCKKISYMIKYFIQLISLCLHTPKRRAGQCCFLGVHPIKPINSNP